MEDIDKRTRKILCMTGNFHRNSDADRLYVKRSDGGRGIKSFESSFKTRTVGIRRHLIRDHPRNHLLENVLHHEKDRIMRLGKEYEEMYLKVNGEDIGKDNTITKRITKEINKQSKDRWQAKVQHGYMFKKAWQKESTDVTTSNLWLKNGKLPSHTEGFLFAVQEQEIDTRALRRQRERDQNVKRSMESQCRMCGKAEENIYHVVAACSHLSSNLYLDARHNPIAKAVYDEITPKSKTNTREPYRIPEQITKTDNLEIWWDYKIPTMSKIPHNRPDMVIWDTQNKTCKIVDICVPLDINVELRHTTKVDNYAPLVDQLQRLNPQYKYQMIPVIIGAMGTVPKTLRGNLTRVGVPEDAIKSLIERVQRLALLGTLKIVKNFQKM